MASVDDLQELVAKEHSDMSPALKQVAGPTEIEHIEAMAVQPHMQSEPAVTLPDNPLKSNNVLSIYTGEVAEELSKDSDDHPANPEHMHAQQMPNNH